MPVRLAARVVNQLLTLNVVAIRSVSRSRWGHVQEAVAREHATAILAVMLPVAQKRAVLLLTIAIILARRMWVDRTANALIKMSHPMVVSTPALRAIISVHRQPVNQLKPIRGTATVRKRR